MIAHLRANLLLLALTLVICCVLYPLVLLGIGQTIFPTSANGSLLLDAEGTVVGSRLIAQSFSGDEYFHPRPSAVSYNAAATGGTNWGANNPALRSRVLAQLDPIVRYGPQGARPGKPVRPDIEAWFQKNHLDGKPETEITPVREGTDVQANVFGMWLQEHPDADLELVPSDMVMASGSGLDPDITLRNALWQLDRVAAAWARKTGTSQQAVRPQIEQLLRDKSHAPLGGLVGVPLVNVLEVNLALRDCYERLRTREPQLRQNIE